MSSLYYQHEQQQREQLRREREEAQQFQYQQQPHDPSYHPSQSQSQSHSQHYHYQEQLSYSHSQEHHPSQNPTPPSSYDHQNPITNPNDTLSNNGEPRTQDFRPSPSRDETLDTLHAMLCQESSGYRLDSYFPPEVLPPNDPEGNGLRLPKQQNIIHGGWREKICQWSYNVVDHFDLPREIVSISLNFFDRYMASLSTAEGSIKSGRASPQGTSGDLALLASLGTLHLATKVHATNHNDYDPTLGPLEEQHHKVPSLSTLANLSRGQFGPASILEMEKLLLVALRWRLHPPTLYAFVTFLHKLLPTTMEDPRFGLKPSIASELFEVAMYVAELSVCDAFFVERQIPSSVIAMAAICTAMEDLLAPEDSSIMAGLTMDFSTMAGSGCFTEDHRTSFLKTCEEHIGLGRNHFRFEESLERLRSMYMGASVLKNPQDVTSPEPAQEEAPRPESQNSHSQRSRTNSYNPPTSPSSIADMSLSTINSTIHSMADTTTNGGGSFKRGDSMVSSIACQSKETLTVDNDDDEVFGDKNEDAEADLQSQSHSHNSNNFRYSPSPPREDAVDEPRVYGFNHTYAGEPHPLRRNQSTTMSCSPIVPLR